MAQIKSYTDLKQSKILAKILPLKSADMRFCYSHTLDGRVTGHYPMIGREPSMGTTPCWSLAALFDVLPKEIVYKKEITFLEFHAWENSLEYVNNANFTLYVTKSYDNPIDACYEMILKLHKLKML